MSDELLNDGVGPEDIPIEEPVIDPPYVPEPGDDVDPDAAPVPEPKPEATLTDIAELLKWLAVPAPAQKEPEQAAPAPKPTDEMLWKMMVENDPERVQEISLLKQELEDGTISENRYNLQLRSTFKGFKREVERDMELMRLKGDLVGNNLVANALTTHGINKGTEDEAYIAEKAKQILGVDVHNPFSLAQCDPNALAEIISLAAQVRRSSKAPVVKPSAPSVTLPNIPPMSGGAAPATRNGVPLHQQANGSPRRLAELLKMGLSDQ
jgi:hypothetical protein